MKLNLGCGSKKLDGYINIDCQEGADVVLDLENAILPYPDGSVETILASHVLEHIHNLIPLVNECHRVLQDGGAMMVIVPNMQFLEAFQDPTHCRYFTTSTWLYWIKGESLHEECGKGYGIKPFTSIDQTTQSFQLITRLIK